jgi:hypothetical protein
MLEAPRAADRADKDGSCTDPFCLGDLEVGKPDKLGNKVIEILWIGAHYAIYCSEKGIYVHFSDSLQTEEIQRERFTAICPELCELRYLTTQMRGWNWWPWSSGERRHTLYEHNMAQALMLTMENKIDAAKVLARQTLAMAIRRVTNDNTIRYVRACFICVVACIAFGAVLLLCLNFFNRPEGLGWRPYVVGGMFGALGALLSIVTRVQAFELKPCNESRMNYWMSTIRIVTGVISAIALLLFADTLLADTLNKFTGIKHITDPIDVDAVDLVIWQAVAVLGLIAGFSERLIPILLRQTADKIEGSAGTPVQAARAQGALPVPQTEPVAVL